MYDPVPLPCLQSLIVFYMNPSVDQALHWCFDYYCFYCWNCDFWIHFSLDFNYYLYLFYFNFHISDFPHYFIQPFYAFLNINPKFISNSFSFCLLFEFFEHAIVVLLNCVPSVYLSCYFWEPWVRNYWCSERHNLGFSCCLWFFKGSWASCIGLLILFDPTRTYGYS